MKLSAMTYHILDSQPLLEQLNPTFRQLNPMDK